MGYFDTKKKREKKAIEKATPTKIGQTKKQTTTIDGVRTVITRRKNSAGEVTVKMQSAAPLEWMLQAAQVTAMRAHKDYLKFFAFAGDMNAGSRGPKAMAEAVATGMTSGEPDLRIYFADGTTVFIENKAGKGKTSEEQDERHALLRSFNHEVHVINGDSERDATGQLMRILNEKCDYVSHWLIQERMHNER